MGRITKISGGRLTAGLLILILTFTLVSVICFNSTEDTTDLIVLPTLSGIFSVSIGAGYIDFHRLTAKTEEERRKWSHRLLWCLGLLLAFLLAVSFVLGQLLS